MDGLLIVNKPTGPTSHDVVARARRALGTSKVGHTGTLDPAASGVLPLVVGRATRLARFLASDEKGYRTTVRFGVTTDTYDAAGTVTSETGRAPAADDLARALEAFAGTFEQRPPAYSAKKIDGVRAYALARQHAPVAPKPVMVTVHRIALLRFDPPVAELELVCSAGFYVRSLAHDLGERLGTGAMLEGLVRISAGRFRLEDTVAFDALEPSRREELAARLIPMEAAVAHLPAVQLTEAGVRRVRHGQDIRPEDMLSAPAAAAASAVGLFDAENRLIAVAGPGSRPGVLHGSVVLG